MGNVCCRRLARRKGCSTIEGNSSSWRFFPFQSYTIQNIEVQTTYEYGSTLSNYTNVFGDGSTNEGSFALIGSTNTLFLLKDSDSKLKKWYNPTTDLVCYEMSGTTQLDAINISVMGISVSSKDYNLPISSSMHVIMNSNATISKPMVVQAGAVIEVKSGYTLTCSSNVYIFDKDNWGEYCNKKYYYTMTNLTNHKNRGNGTSNELIDDAKLIIDGTLNVTGKLYTTAGGADIMSNGGGKIVFSTLPTATNIVMCTGVSDNENVAVASANLHNEDDSYTQVKNNNSTFYNVNGRWFVSGKQNEKPDHTYDFTYISSGAVSGSGGTTTTTDAVYSNDKTGLELQMKWINVTEGECADWWEGVKDGYYYNWTSESAWHQFIPTATVGMYSGSNNKIYTKTDCAWEELGETDINCLYTIGGVKKALVDGEFIALEPNNNDPAYHAADDATKYYICFEGCNWHAADKYTEAEKAYVVGEDIFIWYNGVWMKAERKEPFFYTLSNTNVPIYYEYLNGEWVLAEPYISVVDGIESRTYWFLEDAFTFASGALRKNPTIKILRDISGITTAVTYTGTNKICTLDLNGHTITGDVNGLITVNLAGCTFTIVDNTEEKEGKISLVFSANNSRRYALNVKNGHVILKSGTISATCTLAYNKTSAPKPLTGCVAVASGKQFTMDGGKVEAVAPYYPIAIVGSEGTPTITINAGTVEAVAQTIDSPNAIYAYGTINLNGGTVNAIAEKSSTAIGIYVLASSKAQGTLNMTGGTVNATSYTKNTRGVYVNKVFAYDTNEPRSITAVYPASANISGGEINATNKTSTDAEGIYSLGNTTVTGGEINARCSANTTAFGIRVLSGETRISGSPVINATATGTVYGIRVSKETPAIAGTVYNSTLQMDGGTINAQATTGGTVYGIYVGAATLANTATHASNSKSYAGNYANAGTATITGVTVHAKAHTNTAYGVFVDAEVTESDAAGYATATATPKCTINGGYFTAQATAPAAAVQPIDATVLADNFKISGGYYSHNGNIDTYAVSPKHAVALQETDAKYDPYFYKVAESYNVTFKNGDETLQSSYQEVGKTPVYSGDAPTKASTTTTSYIFDGWSATDGGAVVSPLPNVTSAGATYYAHYTETALKYIATFDAKTNDGAEDNQVIYVEPDAAIGTLPTATKEGYTFSGWFTAASGGTKITTATVPTGDVTYYAQFTVNKYTLTWELGNSVVSAVGKYGSTSWPAKKATGTQSKAVSYGLTLTAPTVTRTGYTFHSWAPLVAATMPAEAVTYTAQWTPKTNTAYTVKHYLQNVDGTYPEEPVETEALTGTTGESVTPEVKEYEGFVSPETETKEIAADGTMVIEYKYERMHYTITLDAATNGGTSDHATIEVIHGATIGAVPPDAQKGCNDFTGWYTKPVGGVKITSDFTIEYNLKTLYAQFSDDVRTYPITYNAGANGTGTVAGGTKTCGEDATLSSSTFTRDGYAQTGWSLTDGGAQAYALGGTYTENAALTLYPVWTVVSYNLTYEGLNGATNSNPATYTIETATITLADPGTRAGYTFTGWTCGGSPITQIALGSTGDKVITANWEKIGVTILWKSEDGETTLETDEGVEIDATPSFNGETPTKTTTAEYTYTFDGWTTEANGAGTFYAIGELPAVAAAAAYYAHFTATPNVASVTVGGSTTYYPTIADAWEAVNTATGAVTLKLLQDVSGVETSLAYTNEQNCTLDLNNHTLSGAVAGNLLNINATGKTFTIDDSSEDKEGILENIKAGGARYYAVFLTAGTLTLEHGTIHSSNPSDASYSSLTTAAKKCMASGVYVTAKQTFNMNGGAVSASAIYYPIGVQSAGITNLKGGSVTATATKFTTAVGVHSTSTTKIYDGVTITASSTKSTTVYGVQVAGSTTTFYGGTIKAHATSSKGTTVSGIYVSSGKANIPATSTVDVEAKSYGKNCYGVQVAASKTANIYGGSFTASSTNANAAYSVYSLGTTNITGGTFTATAKTSNARGVSVPRGTTTISGDPKFTVRAPSSVYGALASATTPSKAGVSYHGTLIIKGGTFDVEATSTTTAYGVYVGAGTGLSMFSTTNDSVPGNYINAGTAEISGGVFNVTAKTSTAYGVFVNKGTQNKNTTMDAVTAYGTCTITGGKFNVKGTSSVGAVNSTATKTNFVIEGGWYNTDTNLDKYTAPAKSCNYHVLPLTGEDPYQFEVAEAYKVYWDATTNGGTCEVPYTIVKKGSTIGSAISPLPQATKPNHSFDGWFTTYTTGGTQAAEGSIINFQLTFYARFSPLDFGAYIDIVDWISDGKIVINTNGMTVANTSAADPSAWQIVVNGTTYTKSDRLPDRTLKLDVASLNLKAGNKVVIETKDLNTGTVDSHHEYTVPQIFDANATLSGTNAESIIYVHNGTLTVNSDLTVDKIYVCPGAELKINSGKTLTVGTLVMRTETTVNQY
ncbi:MAG: InlB B-repeat-containing protein, partial [Paludibacteraceae bacterium]|nr:InlB B-repeat-containing protein [Paludibacteraceae bacterium]